MCNNFVDKFRSQDKHFLVEGAITHIFRQSVPIKAPVSELLPERAVIGGATYWTNAYIAEKINRYV